MELRQVPVPLFHRAGLLMGARMRGIRRFFARLTLAAGVLVLLGLVFLTQTPMGKEWVLREVIARISSGIRGEIEIAGVSSPGLLNGFTFRGVTIRGEDGSVFLSADSIRTGISGPALLRGDLVFSGVHLWNPHVTLERPTDQDPINAEAIFVGVPPHDSAASSPEVIPDTLSPGSEEGSPGRTVLLRDAEIHGGTLDILLPLPRGASDRILLVPGSDGRPPLRRLTFRELELGQATLRAPGQRGERFELRHLSFLGEVWPDPVRVTGAEGDLRREGNRLLASLASLEFPGSRTQGQVDVRWGDDEGVRVSVRGQANPLALEDLFAIEGRLPMGTVRGPFGFELGDDGLLLDFRDTELRSDLGGIRATGGLFLGRDIGFRELAMEVTDLDLSVTDPWVRDTLPLRGRITGSLSMAGDLEELELEGLLDLSDPDSAAALRADFSGRMGLLEGFSASSLQLTLAPLEWGAMAGLSPAMALRGPGAVRLLLNGSLFGNGLRLTADVTHVPRGLGGPLLAASDPGGAPRIGSAQGASRVTLAGRIRKDSTDLFLDLTGELQPLSLTGLRRSFPDLPFQGEYAGSVSLRGPVSDLEATADLETSGGPLSVSGRFDAARIADSYSLQVTAEEDFTLSNVLPALPDPTRLAGTVVADGRGLTMDALEGEARVVLHDGVVGELGIDSILAQATVRGGVLSLSRLIALTEAGRLEAAGFFGVASDAPPGELTVAVESESLEPLRPFLMEVPERTLEQLPDLALAAVDPDTIPTADDVAVAGSMAGVATLRGGFTDFSMEGSFDLQGLRFRRDYLESGTLTLGGEHLPGVERRIRADLRTDSILIRSLGFSGGTAELDLLSSGGRFYLTTNRSPDERYSGRGTYELSPEAGGTVNLDEFLVDFDTVRWNLGGPASFSWNQEGYRVRDFQLVRTGPESMRLRADGLLPLGGSEGDFELDVRQFSLSRLARILQMETPLEGVLDFAGRLTGTSDNPSIVGSVSGQDLRYADFSLGGIESDLQYRDFQVTLALTAREGDREALRATGSFPLDLRLQRDSALFSEAPVHLDITTDSFPAAIALGFMESLEEVEGTVSGEVHIGGTAADLEPSGALFLADGAALLPDLGVRHRGIVAQLTLTPDGLVEVDGSFRSGGTAQVTGAVTLKSALEEVGLDLEVRARDFLAVNRRDVTARLSGTAEIRGSYGRPRISGDLTVEQGEMRVEEVARSVEVLDLSDPTFLTAIDTTAFLLRPILRPNRNPFLQNLRLEDLTLTMARNSWLRGRQLNIEMAGTLEVFWDRTAQNLTFLGALDAVRGTYSVFSRQFQVQEGTVSFPGVPGINPDLNIRALNRLRTPKNEQLEIIATVEGSLLAPRVSLSGNSAFPIGEDDLVSYLIFGQPAYAVGAGQSAEASERATALKGATANLAVGLFSSELGSILTRDVGLDYLAVTQGTTDQFDPGRRQWEGAVFATQVEVGQYLTEDIFAALQWRPIRADNSSLKPLAALRIEGRLADNWTLEGYMEDRFLRTSMFLLGSGDIETEYSFGFFLYRQWGY